MTDTKPLNEPPLPDDYPVYYGYAYVVDGEPYFSDYEETVERLKKRTGATEVCRCDLVGRGLI